MNILYQFNEKYVPYAGASIVSLLENNKDIEQIVLYLVGEKVSLTSKSKLIEQIKLYGREAFFFDAEKIISKIENLGLNDYRGSQATNIKLFVTEFIPYSVRRLLYIDCDTIVTGSVHELETIDMNGKPIAMVMDSMCGIHKQSMGFGKGQDYFNGGVILFDMGAWREQHCTELICEHLIEVRSNYLAPDQDVINIVMKEKIACLDIRYNIQPLHVDYDYDTYSLYFGQPNYYSKHEIEEAMNNPVIYHFFRYLGEFPWNKNCLHPDGELFDRYIAKSLWKDYQKESADHNEFVFKIERWLYEVLPPKIFLCIFKCCYEYMLWKKNHDMKKISRTREL